ncbi:MAG: prolyl oligopeptidase family serine peptidase [Melioribacteraceae bacterium]|nr:prolyl oligopeptidase family serine peptidase [Melioribacteraceae bacterium]MCF8264554.1 prolyl oligopeptidase family serine peptidase [Melioribacteraceae bacterium]MCF8413748.1 prolyl oligopeptidase family serine peptidase [Melioribacteraceae bacterium]
MTNNYLLKTKDSHNIRITTFGNPTSDRCLIFVHGFKGFKDWGFFPYSGKYFADRGNFVITFNYSHNGVGESLTEFTELEKFGENTFSREVDELNQIIDVVHSGFFGNETFARLGIIGHSRGGADVLLTATNREEVDAIVTWASIAKLDRYSERQKIEWREKGVFNIENARTKQIMPLYIGLLNDIESNMNGSLNMQKAASQLNKPWLIAHGKQDLAVPIGEAEQLYEWSDKSKTEMFVLEATGHTFDIEHPFTKSNFKFDKLLEKTNLFLIKHLN